MAMDSCGGFMKYQSKPVIKEAFELQQSYKNWPEWAIEALGRNDIITHNMGKLTNGSDYYATIKTLEGDHRADAGDYIIQGLKGELYPCKPDIFKQSYEPVPEEYCGHSLDKLGDKLKIPTAHGSTMHGMGFR